MSTGAYLQVIMPIINAPFQIYYAYNPLRLYKDSSSADCCSERSQPARAPRPTCFKDFFPFATSPGAAAYSYQQALQYYGADYVLREPRKTFRLTISTSF